MDESKAVALSGQVSEPNTFFIHSPFRSWQFLLNTALVVADCIFFAIVVTKFPSFWRGMSLFALLLVFVVNPYWWAVVRRRKINELFRSGKIVAEAAGSPQNVLLNVAAAAMNDGVCTTSFAYLGILILVLKIH